MPYKVSDKLVSRWQVGGDSCCSLADLSVTRVIYALLCVWHEEGTEVKSRDRLGEWVWKKRGRFCAVKGVRLCVFVVNSDLRDLARGYSRTVQRVVRRCPVDMAVRQCVVNNPLGCANKIAWSATSKSGSLSGFDARQETLLEICEDSQEKGWETEVETKLYILRNIN